MLATFRTTLKNHERLTKTPVDRQHDPNKRTQEHAGYFRSDNSKAQQRHRGVNTVSRDRNKTFAAWMADETAPIIVPDGAGIWTFGDHLRHLAAHRGAIPLERDEFGRCVICVRRGFFAPDA